MFLIRRLLLISFVLLVSLPLTSNGLEIPIRYEAQEKNVRPGINKVYEKPDLEFWLDIFESPGREVYDLRHYIVDSLPLRKAMWVADIGAGTGFFSEMFSDRVGALGKVYAVDISRPFVEAIVKRMHDGGIYHVYGVVNTPKGVDLPENSLDMAFICDTYHHFEYPISMMKSIYKAMRPGSNLIVIDYRRIPRFSSDWVMEHVRANQEQVIKEIESVGFLFVEEIFGLDENYFIRFTKPKGPYKPKSMSEIKE